jgi:hypothetical protein
MGAGSMGAGSAKVQKEVQKGPENGKMAVAIFVRQR